MVTRYGVIGGMWLNKNAYFSPFFGVKTYKAQPKAAMLNCIIFYNSSKKYLQFPSFPDKLQFLVKSTWAAILDEVTDP